MGDVLILLCGFFSLLERNIVLKYRQLHSPVLEVVLWVGVLLGLCSLLLCLIWLSFVCKKVRVLCSLNLLFSLPVEKMCDYQSITSKKNILIPKQCSFDFKLFCKFRGLLWNKVLIFFSLLSTHSAGYRNVTVLNGCMWNNKSISWLNRGLHYRPPANVIVCCTLDEKYNIYPLSKGSL